MENNKLKKFTCCFIMLILVLSLYGCGVSSEQVKDAVANTVIKKCESYGLRNVSIAVSGGEKDDAGFQIFHMTVISSNFDSLSYEQMFATVYKGNIIKNLIMDCQSYTKYRPNETTGGIFVSWRRKEELPTGA